MRTIDLTGKAALITGGTRGIGRTIAQFLAEAGADVALFYRSDDAAARRAVGEIRASTGRRAEAYRADVGDEAAVEAGAAAALADFGAFHVVVHNAGHGPPGGGELPDVTTDHWRGAFAVNLDAAFFLIRAFLRREGALLCGGSSVVFIGSGRGHEPAAGHAADGTAKAALVHFAAMLSRDVGPRGVRVNVVSPGFTWLAHTTRPEAEIRAAAEQTALRRVGTPEDVAGVVLFFASELSAFVTGQWVRVDGGD